MRPSRQRPRSRGQIVVIFALSVFAFIGLCAIVIDVSWFWSQSLRMQRAADAAALAGVVNLPGREDLAILDARAEARKNGYVHATGGVIVAAAKDLANHRRLIVTISGDVGTFFSRVIGINSFHTSHTSKAEYTLPVPMGSPENYYGVFGMTRGLTTSSTVTTPVDTPSNVAVTGRTATIPNTNAGGASPTNSWTASNSPATIPANLAANEVDTTSAARYVGSTTNNSTLDLGNFGLTTGLAANQSVTSLTGLQLILDDAWISAACGSTTNRFLVQVSYNGGTTWSTSTTTTRTANLGINTATVDTTIGATTNLTAWTFASHTWDPDDFDQANFKVRLTASKACTTGSTALRLDRLRVNANYAINTRTYTTSVVNTVLTDENLQGPGTACPLGVSNCFKSDGATLNPRGFWATMNTQGAANGNGDAFQPFYDNAGGTAAPACATAATGLACYDPTNYYNYAIEMPMGATGGKIYVYDPVFCATNVGKGTGDRWFDTSTASKIVAVTSTYELYDTKDTLYDQTDDGTAIASSGTLFRKIKASDSQMGGTATGAPVECKTFSDATYGDGRDYHNNWYLLYSGMTGGVNGPKVYRLHTTSTDPTAVNDQKNVDGENSFALYASATGGTPRLYGIGAMQAFTPLKAGSGGSPTTVTSTFYLAQIERAHAGKTVEIQLWDPGDTDPLTASLEILIPTGTNSWAATPVTYSATLGTTTTGRADGGGSPARPDCRTLSRTTPSATPINTYDTAATSTTGKFNGCWLTISAVIPTTYNAAAGEDWWQIRYTMTGDGTSNDVTTWKADIRGNPVHLILP